MGNYNGPTRGAYDSEEEYEAAVEAYEAAEADAIDEYEERRRED